jgi:hypothetical protein
MLAIQQNPVIAQASTEVRYIRAGQAMPQTNLGLALPQSLLERIYRVLHVLSLSRA